MKTADRENPNHGAALPRNRAHSAISQNRSRSLKWAEKQENFQPKKMCFFLTSTFIEPIKWIPLKTTRLVRNTKTFSLRVRSTDDSKVRQGPL